MKTNGIKANAEKDLAYITALRRDFHMNPETAREEFNTAARIEEELDKIGVKHRRVGETGVIGILKGEGALGNGCVLLRADIDALPLNDEKTVPYKSRTQGKCHACGHDAHTAGLIGAARILSEMRGEFSGEIRFMFQQGEEIGYGARVFIKEGELRGVDRVFGFHTAPDIQSGKIGIRKGANNASVDHITIKVKGLGAHISTPQKGVDALHIISEIASGSQGLVTRLFAPTDPILLGFGLIKAGSAYNIVANEGLLEGTIRAFSAQSREKLKKALSDYASSVAESFGGSATTEYEDFTCPLINDSESCDLAEQAVAALYGKEAICRDRQLSLGGDDFAELLKEAPGCYMYLGTANADNPDTCVPHHNNHFDIDENALAADSAILALCALIELVGEENAKAFL